MRMKAINLITTLTALAVLAFAPQMVYAQGACSGVDCDTLPDSVCTDLGSRVTLVDYQPAPESPGGSATYTYEICSPPPGVCEGGSGLRAGESCLDDSFCQKKGSQNDPGASCTRDCAVSEFRALSHFDVTFPTLGDSCLGGSTLVTGGCRAIDNTPDDGHAASVGSFGLGDGSCSIGSSTGAKCDSTDLAPGDCVEMTLNIPGELNSPGLGAAVVVDKASTSCTESCIAGPSCDSCDNPPQDEEDPCLTRTIGFWGTHPWITNDFTPVQICGVSLGCSGVDPADPDKSIPYCAAGECNSVMEGLGSNPPELPSNQNYVAMVKQLTAAKLNMKATFDLIGGSCTDWEYEGKSIQKWIDDCELLCGANKQAIAASGCVAALNEFNNSPDTGLLVTPAPFDRPPVDDSGNISGADPTEFLKAHGNRNFDKLVIGKNLPGAECAP